MKKFYKIENGQLQVGTGTQAPDGFIEFEGGKEPEELLDAIEVERLEQELQNKHVILNYCPHCGHSLPPNQN